MTWYVALSMFIRQTRGSKASSAYKICTPYILLHKLVLSFAVLQVGGFCIMMKEDMKRVAPLWLKFSKKVRHDPDVCISTCSTPLVSCLTGPGTFVYSPRMRPCTLRLRQAAERPCVQAWNLTGDAFTKTPGDKPWISEM